MSDASVRLDLFWLVTCHSSLITLSMIIGVPKEIKEQEQRVALLPSAANQLTRRGHSVLVEKTRASAPVIPMKITSRPARRLSILPKMFSRAPT